MLPRYADCVKLEKAFMDGPGLTRFFGNHDIDWRDPGKVKKHLAPLLPGIEVLEALKLRVLDGDTPLGLLFLVHGHQGTDLSDRGSGSRASSCAGSGARSRIAWAGCRRRRPATTTCAPSTTSRCSAGAGAPHSPRPPTSARR